jgi:hypothetical protein
MGEGVSLARRSGDWLQGLAGSGDTNSDTDALSPFDALSFG